LKALLFIVLVLFFAVMLYAAALLPPRGDVNAPIHRAVSAAGTPVAGTYFVTSAFADAATANIVTVVLADYRSFDTLGETIVVFTAGIACLLILRRRP
jgi:multicomponent Na+:H+ antiporter subunit B